MNKKLLNDVLDSHQYIQFFRKKKLRISNELVKNLKDQIIKLHDSPKSDIRYEYNVEKLSYYFQFYKNMDIGKSIISADFYIPPKLSEIECDSLIEEVFGLDKRIKFAHFNVPINSKLYQQLIKRGAKLSGNKLLATVDDGLKYLKQYEFDSNIVVSELKRSEAEEATELEYLAHKESSSSRCENMGRNMFRWFIGNVLKTKKKTIVVRENGEILGLCVPFKDSFGMGHLMTVTVHPNAQGRGVSKVLYYHALKYFKSKKIKAYTGVSSTEQVLEFSKRLGRVADFAYLEIKRCTPKK